jgi:hypothetical protein
VPYTLGKILTSLINITADKVCIPRPSSLQAMQYHLQPPPTCLLGLQDAPGYIARIVYFVV